jgi:hypothetical protein
VANVEEHRTSVHIKRVSSSLFHSAKKSQSEFEKQGGELLERPQVYTIEVGVGQLEVTAFETRKGPRKVFRTKREVFPETGSREHHKTVCIRELAVFYSCDETFRKSAQKLNRVLWRKEG